MLSAPPFSTTILRSIATSLRTAESLAPALNLIGQLLPAGRIELLALGDSDLAAPTVNLYVGWPEAQRSDTLVRWADPAAKAWLQALRNAPLSESHIFAPADSSQRFVAAALAVGERWWGMLVCADLPDDYLWDAAQVDLLGVLGELVSAALARRLAQLPTEFGAADSAPDLSDGLLTAIAALSRLLPIDELDDLLREAVIQAHRSLGVTRPEIVLNYAGHLRGTFAVDTDGQIIDQRGMIIPDDVFWADRHDAGGTGAMRLYRCTRPLWSDELLAAEPEWEAIIPLGASDHPAGYLIAHQIGAYMPDGFLQRLIEVYAGTLGPLIERTLATATARQRDQHYRMLVETSPDGIALVAADGTIERCNEMLAQLYGHASADQLVGASIRDLISPEQLMYLAQSPRSVYAILTRHDGTQRHTEINIGAITHVDGVLQGLVVVTRDITDRVQAQEELRQAYGDVSRLNTELRRSRDVLRTLFDGLSDGLMLLDARGVVLAINRALAALIDVEPVRLIGRRWAEACAAPTGLDGLIIPLDMSVTDAQPRRVRLELANHPPRMLDVRSFPLLDNDGNIDQVVMHVSDITQRLQFETRMIEVERFAASGRLAATVAHEVNTPLQSIQSFLYLLDHGSIAKRAEYHELIRNEISRIAQIINQLLDLYRPSVSAVGAINMNMLAERVLLLNDYLIGQHRVQVRRILAPDLPKARGRADQMMQVLVNLVVNALQAMQSGGELTIETCARPALQSIAVLVSDTGGGIDPTIAERIFEPFFTTKPEGTGLGLSICRQIVNEHGGQIEVSRRTGGGTTFSVTLPLFGETQSNAEPPCVKPARVCD